MFHMRCLFKTFHEVRPGHFPSAAFQVRALLLHQWHTCTHIRISILLSLILQTGHSHAGVFLGSFDPVPCPGCQGWGKKRKKEKRERAKGFEPDQYKKHIYIFLTDYSAIYTVKHTKQYTIFKFLKLFEYAVFNMHVFLMMF